MGDGRSEMGGLNSKWWNLHQCQNAGGAAGYAGDHGAGGDEGGSGGRKGAKAGHALHAPPPGCQPAAVDGEISRGSIIQAEGVHANAFDLPFFKQEVGRLLMEAGKMHHTLGIGIAKLVGAHVQFPSGEHGENSADRQRAVIFLPFVDVGGG